MWRGDLGTLTVPGQGRLRGGALDYQGAARKHIKPAEWARGFGKSKG